MIFTFGHSTLSHEAGVRTLKDAGITTLIDIRSHPGSKWEQWRKENLEESMPASGIEYIWMPSLGGWDKRHLPMKDDMAKYGVDLEVYAKGKFPKQRIAPERKDDSFFTPDRPSWTNQGLWDFQFFMATREFLHGASGLINLYAEQEQERVAIMCCELLWWKCHRSMVADYLTWRHVDVYHLQPKFKLHADALGNRLERYHDHVIGAWAGYRP